MLLRSPGAMVLMLLAIVGAAMGGCGAGSTEGDEPAAARQSPEIDGPSSRLFVPSPDPDFDCPFTAAEASDAAGSEMRALGEPCSFGTPSGAKPRAGEPYVEIGGLEGPEGRALRKRGPARRVVRWDSPGDRLSGTS